MIQRIQSVYLAIITILCGLVFVFPFGEITIPNGSVIMDGFSIISQDSKITAELFKPWPVTILARLAALLAPACIAQFKNRTLQMKMCRLNALFLLGLIFSMFYLIDKAQAMFEGMQIEAEIHYGIGTYLPLLAVVLNILATRAIKKDDKLVRSADRLR